MAEVKSGGSIPTYILSIRLPSVVRGNFTIPFFISFSQRCFWHTEFVYLLSRTCEYSYMHIPTHYVLNVSPHLRLCECITITMGNPVGDCDYHIGQWQEAR